MKRLLFLLPLLVIAAVAGLSAFLQPDDFSDCEATPTTGTCAVADAIVVVSGGDTNARTDAGIELYKQGWARAVIFSGAAQDKTGPSNAAAMQTRALEAGVPAQAIMIDEESATTQQNAANTQGIFARNNYRRIILVTSGYHQRRALIEFERQTNGAEIVNHPVREDKDWSFWWWLTPRGWWLAGGELAKIFITVVSKGTV